MGNITKKATNKILQTMKNKMGKDVIEPLNNLMDQNVQDVTTTIGSFVVRSVRGKFQRSISFTIGSLYADRWMEEALYGILYKYNDIKKSSRLELTNKAGYNDGSGMYYRLDDGTHNLKYRNYDILLVIQTHSSTSMSGRITGQRIYTIITYNLDPDFVKYFEKDMIANRNALLKIKSDAPTVSVFKDGHEGDGYTYWERVSTINKRRLDTIYLPYEQKKLIVDTINDFFTNKKSYIERGVDHNLKILLYGEPGSGKDTIARMIASEWNRNIYYVTGGKQGQFIPDAITDNSDDVISPLFIISDIDKYPYLINEPEINKEDKNNDEQSKHKQIFGNMINGLNGILSGQDRIIVMTTNHIEKFSDTFLRPGRVDLKMYITYVTPEVFRQYVRDFYHINLPNDIKFKENNITIAKMQFDSFLLKMTAEEFLNKYLVK